MFAETEDQELFERAAKRFLEAHYPIARVREIARAASTIEPQRLQKWRAAPGIGSKRVTDSRPASQRKPLASASA